MARRSPATASSSVPPPELPFELPAPTAVIAAGLASLVALAGHATPASAQVYRCQSDGGVVEYTNTPRARCARLDPAPLSSAPVPARALSIRGGGAPGATGVAGSLGTVSGAARPSVAAPGPVQAPGALHARIDPATQRARDSDRRRILEDELGRELARLDDLRREAASVESGRRPGEPGDPKLRDRSARLRDDIGRSEGNVSALRRELASLRN